MVQKSKKINVPNPGSREAELVGCTCPVVDNHYGDGRPDGYGGYSFITDGDCSIHGFTTEMLEQIKEEVKTA